MNLTEKLREIIEEVFPQKEYSIEIYNDGFKLTIAVKPTIIIVVNLFMKDKILVKMFSVNTEIGYLKEKVICYGDIPKTNNIYENNVYDLDFLQRILKNYEFFE